MQKPILILKGCFLYIEDIWKSNPKSEMGNGEMAIGEMDNPPASWGDVTTDACAPRALEQQV